jgi:hypothetical protein
MPTVFQSIVIEWVHHKCAFHTWILLKNVATHEQYMSLEKEWQLGKDTGSGRDSLW